MPRQAIAEAEAAATNPVLFREIPGQQSAGHLRLLARNYEDTNLSTYLVAVENRRVGSR